ncbi:MAG: ATP-binding protein [Thermonemataceae bacterium]
MEHAYYQRLEKEFDWLEYKIIDQLLTQYPQLSEHFLLYSSADFVETSKDTTENFYTKITKDLSINERFLLVMSLAAYMAPHRFEPFHKVERAVGGWVPLFGGLRDQDSKHFMPTFQTALFILSGINTDERFNLLPLFAPDNVLYKQGLLMTPPGHFKPDYPLQLTHNGLQLLLTGQPYQPQYSAEFPASQLETSYDWSDLVLSKAVMQQVEEIKHWIIHEKQIMQEWELSKHLKKGYRAIFSGKSGTGKTLTATLLGKETELPVYRIDISSLVSKYVGETEKNLESLFQMAENRNWILFFDEAESLFSRRSAAKNANDNYANQTVGYLLQRVEDYNGMIILCTNKPTNIDAAFTRRFQSIITFPEPSEEERLRLWEKTFQQTHLAISEEIDFKQLAKTYNRITGGILIII